MLASQFSGLPVFSAGAYELGRDRGPIVAEGLVSPFSVRLSFSAFLHPVLPADSRQQLSAAEQDPVTSPTLLPSGALPLSKPRSPSPASAASTFGSTLTGEHPSDACEEA